MYQQINGRQNQNSANLNLSSGTFLTCVQINVHLFSHYTEDRRRQRRFLLFWYLYIPVSYSEGTQLHRRSTHMTNPNPLQLLLLLRRSSFSSGFSCLVVCLTAPGVLRVHLSVDTIIPKYCWCVWVFFNQKLFFKVPTYLWTRPEMDTKQRLSLCVEETVLSAKEKKKDYLTEQNSGLWAVTNLTRHGSGFPLPSTFGPKLFLLIRYLHISKVACLRFLNSAAFLPCRFFLFCARTEECDGQIKSTPVDLNDAVTRASANGARTRQNSRKAAAWLVRGSYHFDLPSAGESGRYSCRGDCGEPVARRSLMLAHESCCPQPQFHQYGTLHSP